MLYSGCDAAKAFEIAERAEGGVQPLEDLVLEGYKPTPTDSTAPRNRAERSGTRPQTSIARPTVRAGWREALILTPLALLLARAILPGAIAPAGLAFVLALSMAGVDHLFLYVLAASLGLLSSVPPIMAAANTPAFLAAVWFGQSRQIAMKPGWLVTCIVPLAALGQILAGGIAVWPAVAFGGAATAALAFAFARALPVLRHGLSASGSNGDGAFLALIPMALTVLGLHHLTVLGLSLAAAFAAFLVVFVGYLGGPGLGAAMGALLAVAPGVGYEPWPIAGGLALGGMLGGLLRQSGRLAMLFGFSAGLGIPLAVQELTKMPAWPIAGQALLGMGMFLALPERAMERLGLADPAEHSWAAAKRSEQARLRDLLSERVKDLAQIFTQLSKAFVAADRERIAIPDLYTLLEQVTHSICQQCSGYEVCWRQNFYASYRELFDLIALAEMNGFVQPEKLRGRLATACFQRHKLLEAIQSILGRVQSEQQTRQQTEEGRGFVADQLEGVANIMTGLAREMQQDVEFRLEIEERLKASFNRLGLSVDSLSVLDYGQDMLEVRLKKHGCLNYCECQYLICPMVGRLLGHNFMVWEKQCPEEPRQTCSFTLVPAGKFQVRHATAQIAKDRESCGDSYALVQTRDGRFALILSDGMGTGPKAAKESRATVDLLAQLLSSGLKEDFALNLINTVLMLRTPEERFATIDVALIDLFRGEVELIKVGAAPSYIKRNREVIPIEASTPPAGILQQVEIDRQRHPLAAGDCLILASDGIFAGELGPEETEDWVEKALGRLEVAGPQPIAEFLIKIAETNMGKEIKDDVTVIVAQLMPAGAW